MYMRIYVLNLRKNFKGAIKQHVRTYVYLTITELQQNFSMHQTLIL